MKLTLEWQFLLSVLHSQKSEIRKCLFDDITIADMELTSCYDIEMQHYGLVPLPFKDIMEHGTLKYMHQYLLNTNFSSSQQGKLYRDVAE